jgi:hypothetical protein
MRLLEHINKSWIIGTHAKGPTFYVIMVTRECLYEIIGTHQQVVDHWDTCKRANILRDYGD